MSHPWQGTNTRMALVAGSLRRKLGSEVHVRRVRYRMHGWNDDGRAALLDSTAALAELRLAFTPAQIVLVGHSMGARVAAHLSAGGNVGAVVALAPWWPRDDAELIPVGVRLRVLHGTADTRTDAESSRVQTVRARARGVDAQWHAVPDAGHALVRHWRRWHELTAEYVSEQLCGGEPQA